MSAYVTRELILLACSIWQGAVLGFWYDLMKTARKLIRHSHAAVSAEDLCYWTAAALYLFVKIYEENSGILRGYLFGGILCGAVLYHASLGRFLSDLLAKGIKKTGRMLLFPGKWLVKSVKKRRKRLKFHGKNGNM
ncbi:spore cortex biosynthesis protein YabQ [Fusicatenibacter sp.]